MPDYNGAQDQMLEERAIELIRQSGHEPDPASVMVAKDVLRELDEMATAYRYDGNPGLAC